MISWSCNFRSNGKPCICRLQMYLLLDNVEKEFKQTPKKRERERRGYGGDCGWCNAKQKDSTPLKAIRATTCLGRQPLSWHWHCPASTFLIRIVHDDDSWTQRNKQKILPYVQIASSIYVGQGPFSMIYQAIGTFCPALSTILTEELWTCWKTWRILKSLGFTLVSWLH